MFYKTKNNEYPSLNFRSDLNGYFLNPEIPKKLNNKENEEMNKTNSLKMPFMQMNPFFNMNMKNYA